MNNDKFKKFTRINEFLLVLSILVFSIFINSYVSFMSILLQSSDINELIHSIQNLDTSSFIVIILIPNLNIIISILWFLVIFKIILKRKDFNKVKLIIYFIIFILSNFVGYISLNSIIIGSIS
ncbi:MAG: hypothetical protein ACK4IX_05070 [Candidatus Sericytochromatia bacterium]